MKTLFKNNIMNLLAMLILALIAFTTSSCSKEKGCMDPKALNYNPNAEESSGDCQYATPTPTPTTAPVSLEIHQHMGTGHLDTTITYTLSSGQRYNMGIVRYYISNVSLVKDNSSEVKIPNSYLLVQPSIEKYALGEVEVGTYNKVRFYLGIDSVTNSSGTMPTDRPAGHPLGLQNPSMFWTWASGYIFLKIEGLSDTIGTGPLDHHYTWHLGTNSLLRMVEVPINPITLTAGQESSIHLKADLKKIVDMIDFRTEHTTHTMGNKGLAEKIMDKAATIFEEH